MDMEKIAIIIAIIFLCPSLFYRKIIDGFPEAFTLGVLWGIGSCMIINVITSHFSFYIH